MSTQSFKVWFRCKEITILKSTNNPTVTVAVRKSVLVTRKLLKAMVLRLTCEGGKGPYLTHISLISILDETIMKWSEQFSLRNQMSTIVMLGKIEDPEMIELNFRAQVEGRMGGKREGPIEAYPKLRKLELLEKGTGQFLCIHTWIETYKFVKQFLSMFLESDLIPSRQIPFW